MSDSPQPPNELQDRSSQEGQNVALSPLPEPGPDDYGSPTPGGCGADIVVPLVSSLIVGVLISQL